MNQEFLQQMKQEDPGSGCVTFQRHSPKQWDSRVTAQQVQEGSNHKPLGLQLPPQAMVMASTGHRATIAPQPPPEQLRGRRMGHRLL